MLTILFLHYELSVSKGKQCIVATLVKITALYSVAKVAIDCTAQQISASRSRRVITQKESR